MVGKTKLEEEKDKKKKRAEFFERLEVLGQESDTRAAKWVKEDFKERQKKEDYRRAIDLTALDTLRKRPNKQEYLRYLGQVFVHFAKEEDLGKYRLEVDITDIGVVCKITGTDFYGAHKAIGVPQYDYIASKTMAVKLGNTIAHLRGYRREQGGVLLPDEVDLKQYGKQVQKGSH